MNIKKLWIIFYEWLTGEPYYMERLRRSPEWKKLVAEILKKHPYCVWCGALITEVSLEVHHYESFHEHPELELAIFNLVVLCQDRGRRNHVLARAIRRIREVFGKEKPGSCHFRHGHLNNWRKINPKLKEQILKLEKERREELAA